MRQRIWISAFILATSIGCGKSDKPAVVGTTVPNGAAQMNISGPQPIVLGPDTIQAEIDKAGEGIKLVRLDLSSAGLPLRMDAPMGAKVERDPHASLLSDGAAVQVSAGDQFMLRIHLGKNRFLQKSQLLVPQKALVNTKDLIVSESMYLLDARCEFARHLVVGLQDYCVENVSPLLGKQINHSQADCLLMLKCAATLTPKLPPPDDPVAALQQFNAALIKGVDGQVEKLSLDPRQSSDAMLALVAKLGGLQRLILRRCPITDEGLAHLAHLTSLKELNLADCAITDAGLSSLSNLVNLEVLNLASSFGDSPRIQGHGLAALARLTKLQALVLDKNLVDDAALSNLKPLKSLKELHLEQTRVVGPGLANLRELSNLTMLSLNETKVTDAGLEGLNGVPSLQVLNLRGTLVQGEGLARLNALKNLHTLHLGSTPLSDASLSSLTSLTGLRRLNLEDTRIGDAGLQNLQAMKGLRSVALARTKATTAGVDKLKASVPGIAITMK